jgi:hypothetical protein
MASAGCDVLIARAMGQSSLQNSQPRLIAVQESFRDTGVADDFVAQVARDSFRPVAPEYDFLMHVDDAHAGRQAVEDAVTDVGVVK